MGGIKLSQKVRVAVIGCGSIAKHRHIPEYGENPHVELVAFCDPVIERAEFFANQYGGRAYQDYHEMLQSEKIDAVSICTPNAVHAPASIEALKAKCHVLCEKPMATSMDEASEMIKTAEEHQVQLMIGHNQRLMSPHQKAKEILASGKLGKVLTFQSSFAHGGPESWSVDGEESWFFRKEEAFVGALGDLGVHKIDLVVWLLEEDIVEVSSMIGRFEKKGDVEDNAFILARTESGTMGTFIASWTHSPGEDNSTILYCEKGILKIGTDVENPVIAEFRSGETVKYQLDGIATNEEGGQTKSGVIDAFIESIHSEKPVPITGLDGKKALKIVLAAIQSATTKENITI